MDELINISESSKGEKVVSARELHAFLESGKDFTSWIKYRIAQYGFEEGIDYEIIYPKFGVNSGAGRPSVDYALILDTAKEIAMVEGNEKGRKIRKYFIAFEKRVRQMYQVPQSFGEALQLAARQQLEIEKRDLYIKRLVPKAEYADRVMDSSRVTRISMACKLLKLGYGRNIFFAVLRAAGIFFQNINEPMQEFVTKGYFEIKQKPIPMGKDKLTGEQRPDKLVYVPYLTQKGMLRMAEWLKEADLLTEARAKAYIAKKLAERKAKKELSNQ